MKDRIILLNLPPAIDFSYNNKGAIYPSAALLIIGTLLTDKGYEVIIIDGAYQENYLKLLADTLTSKTAFVGMSVMTTQVSLALESAAFIKSVSDVPVIWGGPHPTLFPEQTVANEKVDVVAIDEGALTALELADRLVNGKDIGDVKGIGFKDKNGKICITPSRKPEKITDLPFFDFNLIKLENYIETDNVSVYQREFPMFSGNLRIMPILTGLGCPYKCEFCINVILKRRYRFRDALSIVNEIEKLQNEYDVNTFLFLDEDFFINKKRLFEFIALVEERGLKFNWRMWCRVDHFKEDYINDELLSKLSN